VPVNIRLDAGAIAYVLKHAEVSAVVVDEALRADPALAAVLEQLAVPLILTMSTAGGGRCARAHAGGGRGGHASTLPEVAIDSDQPALIMYTSGTTGNPKGAVHSHASVAAALMGNLAGLAITEHDVFSGVLPLYHCAQHCLVATVHIAGGCVVLLRGFVPDEVRASMRQERYTVFVGLPMMRAAGRPGFSHGRHAPGHLRHGAHSQAAHPADRRAPDAQRAAGHRPDRDVSRHHDLRRWSTRAWTPTTGAARCRTTRRR
jgi:long-chain acyl-CoA synthetase